MQAYLSADLLHIKLTSPTILHILYVQGMGLYWTLTHFTMRTYGNIRNFDLLKALGDIERVVKSDFFRKRPISLIRAQHVLSYHVIEVP